MANDLLPPADLYRPLFQSLVPQSPRTTSCKHRHKTEELQESDLWKNSRDEREEEKKEGARTGKKEIIERNAF